jgi:hypothetical protein
LSTVTSIVPGSLRRHHRVRLRSAGFIDDHASHDSTCIKQKCATLPVASVHSPRVSSTVR